MSFLLKESTFGIFMEARQRIPHVISALRSDIIKITGKSDSPEADITKLINSYFKDIAWSIEKDEWSKMSKTERKEFIKAVITKFDLTKK